MNKRLQSEFKTLLMSQLDQLIKDAENTVDDMSSETEKEVYPDETDRATLERDRNFLLRIRDRERQLIGKIKEALGRIDRKQFGVCESCGGDISVARLRARPVTTLCIECKTESERKEKLAH
ncbi:MAG: RNA polymerase-binding protein DksA [Deltaproteobacteria bacterium RIFCSPHIGHO2_02_FULL_40_11]|nr:MAG: RNA polymerase-binding protein DksA [Deltaproteobacteria bacterium RIFCSPHIGHO2_02_FULL_40_11]